MSIVLRGLSWDDPRGYGPLEAVDQAFAASTVGPQVTVRWDIQPLCRFESAPLEHLAERFDLLVIDHPHIGEAVDRGCLAPVGRLPNAFVGPVRKSYSWQGEQWAVPIDIDDLQLVDGQIPLPKRPGLGIELNEEAIGRFAVE